MHERKLALLYIIYIISDLSEREYVHRNAMHAKKNSKFASPCRSGAHSKIRTSEHKKTMAGSEQGGSL